MCLDTPILILIIILIIFIIYFMFIRFNMFTSCFYSDEHEDHDYEETEQKYVAWKTMDEEETCIMTRTLGKCKKCKQWEDEI